MNKIKVVVVDDSALVRGLLSEIINRQPDMQCVGAAADPLIAREMIRNTDPDVITLDIEMPRMDGLEFLSRLMRLRPTPVVMVSTLTERGAEVTLRALELGAVDFVAKPKVGVAGGLGKLADDITEKIRVAAKAQLKRLPTGLAPAAPKVSGLGKDNAGQIFAQATALSAELAGRTVASAGQAPAGPSMGSLSTEKLIFIGASTGGTEATKEVLVTFPHDAPAVLITQHMPPGFTRSYAARLDSLCKIRVKEGSDGERVLPGHAYIAPGGFQMAIDRSGSNYVIRVFDGEPVNRHKPSVEVLFDSAAKHAGRNAVALMLTGMGGDGAKAMKRLRDAGSYNFVQDEASCVVFGMPREAIACGAAHEVLPLHSLGPRVIEYLKQAFGSALHRV